MTTKTTDLADSRPTKGSEADAVAKWVHRIGRSEVHLAVQPHEPSEQVPYIVLPEGKRIESLAPLLEAAPRAPRLHRGDTELLDEVSFLHHIGIFADPHTVLYLAPGNQKTTAFDAVAVYDHATPDEPSFEFHTASYRASLSAEVQAWMAVDGRWMAQGDFARFLEDRVLDLSNDTKNPALTTLAEALVTTVGGPAQIVGLARSLQVAVSAKVSQALVTETGELSVSWEETHEARSNHVPVRVPSLFALSVPVVEGGGAYLIPVRLSYQVREQRVQWRASLYRLDRTLQHVTDEAAKRMAGATGRAVLRGRPRSA